MKSFATFLTEQELEEGNRLKALRYALGRLPGNAVDAVKATGAGIAALGPLGAAGAVMNSPGMLKAVGGTALAAGVLVPPALTIGATIADYRREKKSLDGYDKWEKERSDRELARREAKLATPPPPSTDPKAHAEKVIKAFKTRRPAKGKKK